MKKRAKCLDCTFEATDRIGSKSWAYDHARRFEHVVWFLDGEGRRVYVWVAESANCKSFQESYDPPENYKGRR